MSRGVKCLFALSWNCSKLDIVVGYFCCRYCIYLYVWGFAGSLLAVHWLFVFASLFFAFVLCLCANILPGHMPLVFVLQWPENSNCVTSSLTHLTLCFRAINGSCLFAVTHTSIFEVLTSFSSRSQSSREIFFFGDFFFLFIRLLLSPPIYFVHAFALTVLLRRASSCARCQFFVRFSFSCVSHCRGRAKSAETFYSFLWKAICTQSLTDSPSSVERWNSLLLLSLIPHRKFIRSQQQENIKKKFIREWIGRIRNVNKFSSSRFPINEKRKLYLCLTLWLACERCSGVPVCRSHCSY